MNGCALVNSPKYQEAQRMLPNTDKYILYGVEKEITEKYGRFAYMDEIPGANSSAYLKSGISFRQSKSFGYAYNNDIQNYTSTKSPQEAMIKMNNELHRDLITNILPIGETSIIDITRRPSKNWIDQSIEDINIDTSYNRSKNKNMLCNMFIDLGRQFGINMNPITNQDVINNEEFNGVRGQISNAAGFIHNGQIYINTDLATIDTPIHELMHLFLGSIRYTQPDLYFGLVQSAESLPNFIELAKPFAGRAMSDINEEVFVQEFSKFLVAKPSMFDSIDSNIIDNIYYELYRNIDSMLLGKYSVNNIHNQSITDKSILQLCKDLQSTKANPLYSKILDDAKAHRFMGNIKEYLIKNNELEVKCYG